MKTKSILFICCLLGLACSSCDFKSLSNEKNSNDIVSIAIQPSENLTITSPNPVKIKKGDNAYFNFSVDAGYKLKNVEYAEIINDKIILRNANYSQTLYTKVVKTHEVYLCDTSDDHYIVTSENPCIVEDGETAYFTIDFDPQYTFESSEHGTFSDGIFSVSNVNDNLNVSFAEKYKGSFHYKIVTDLKCGNVITKNGELLDDYIDSPKQLELEAIPFSGKRFVCWTLGGSLVDKMPYSFSRKIKYNVNEDVLIYANYWDNDQNTIIYNGNGGLTNSLDEQIYFPYTLNNRVRVNTIQGTKAFKREGYQLESWNTKQDGSGERIGLGSRFKINNSEKPEILYAQWIKESSFDDFIFELDSSKEFYKIQSCCSDDSDLVIPNLYNKLPVKIVKTNAFDSLSFSRLFLNESIEKVEEDSIINCLNFNELHFYDSLITIGNKFYRGKKPSKLFINANTDPCYGGSYQSLFARKTDLLLECDSEKFVFIGNSNTLYSIDGQMISEHFDKDVLCFGVQAGVGIPWELIVLEHYCKDDQNTVVFCNEFGSARTYGDFSETNFYAAESNYDLLSYIDFNINEFGNIYDAYSSYKKNKTFTQSHNYFKNDYNCDKYGCIKLNSISTNSEDWCSSEITIDFNDYLNGGFDWAKSIISNFSNSTFLMSCCSFNRNCIKEETRNKFYSEYQKSFFNSGCKVISSLFDYAFPGNAFTTDNYHLISNFCIIRTENLIKDISVVL